MTARCNCGDCTPARGGIANRPGLPEFAYRLGTQPTFLRQLLAKLPTFRPGDGPGPPPLADLTTRESSDPSIALLDAWATVADILSFYQERIANEGFLRTSTERRSILELARTIAYELDPGLAAGTYLAFTVEDAPGAPRRAAVAERTRVQSIPAQGEKPQTFETVTSIEARAEWNAMRARATRPQAIRRGLTTLLLQGLDTRLQPGDAILLVGNERIDYTGSERWDVRVLDEVDEDFDSAVTRVSWATPLGSETPTVDPAGDPRVYAFRQRAALFGHNAPDFRAMPLDIKQAFDPDYPDHIDRRRTQWPDFEITRGDDPIVDLDAAYPKILASSWVALVKPSYTELYRVVEAEIAARTDFTLTSKTTRLTFDTREHLHFFGLRDTLVLAQTEELTLAEEPVTEPIHDDRILLAGSMAPLDAGRAVVVTGRPAGSGEGHDPVAEVAFVEAMEPSGGDTLLNLAADLVNSYDPGSVVVGGNVARATHGETTEEVLGGGRGEQPNQSFALRKPPLTYVSSQAPGGSSSTLTVRVDGVAWAEAGSLFGRGARDQSYVVRVDDDGIARVTFGDGTSGARLPTGAENVTAVYRSGLGPDGNLPPGRISLLLTRPLGVREVTNPVAGEGGSAPERRDDARRNAPTTVLTLDRIVSLRDYEDFARSFAGIGKAFATALWDGAKRLVSLTITGPDGAILSPSSDVYLSLSAAVEAARDRTDRVVLDNYEPRYFALSARLLVDGRYVMADVLDAARGAVADAFSFEARSFARPVTAAEVVATFQSVDGVVATDLDALWPTEDPSAAGSLTEFIPTRGAFTDDAGLHPAQIRTVDPAGIEILEMTP